MLRLSASSPLVAPGPVRAVRAVHATLARFGAPALLFAAAHGIRIVPLPARRRYREVSNALRRLGVDVDAWPVPPSGLFVVEERTVYLRSASPMTVAHEFGHALDCALGGGVYVSGCDPRVRAAFAGARSFVTPYAASGLDEYFAESVRAYVEINDERSPWPKATRERLLELDPSMFAYIDELFSERFARSESSREAGTCSPPHATILELSS